MSTSRIKIAKDKGEFVKSLVDSPTAPFSTYADVVAFAAALGTQMGFRKVLEGTAKEPSPINLEIFISRDYEWIIKLLAIVETEDPAILLPFEATAEEERLTIFEEYANAGLEKLQNELRGSVDYTDRILLLINSVRFAKQKTTEEFDLSRFL